MKWATIRVSVVCGLVAAVLLLGLAAAVPSGAQVQSLYPAAWEDPVVEGAFTTANEYRGANRVRDNLNVGWFYKEHRENWTVKGVTYQDTMTLFQNHFFEDAAYSTLDLYDLNGFEFVWGDDAGTVQNKVMTWVFEPGNHPDEIDSYWLDAVGIGAASYPNGVNDDGGFLVRLNDNPASDKWWHPGQPEPGDPAWNFADYYGVFARAGFNDSAYTKGYSDVVGAREIYEWSITLNRPGGIPGVPPGPGNPPPPGVCNPLWWGRGRKIIIKDPKPGAQGQGQLNAPAPPGWWVIFNRAKFKPAPPIPGPDPFPGEVIAEPDVHSGRDYLQTTSGTWFIFPGIGRVDFKSNPIDPANLGDADTIVEREEDAQPAPGAPDIIDTEMLSLSLVGVNPVSAMGSFFDVYITLDMGPDHVPGTGDETPTLGQATISHEMNWPDDSEDTPEGMFDSWFDVHADALFCPVGTQTPMFVIDIDCRLESSGAEWSHTYTHALHLPGQSSFFLVGTIEEMVWSGPDWVGVHTAEATQSRPAVTAPVGGAFPTTPTPPIQWTNAFTSGMIGYRVRVCSTDDPTANVIYDSGELVGSATSKVTTALPTNTHLWAFVNEQYIGWTGWSLAGNGGFYCVTSPPTTPTVTFPSGTVVGAKPSVIFSGGVLHNQFEVKIATDSGGWAIVWDSGTVNSLKNGASCPVMLTPGTQYYAFARAGNPIGWSAWSAASPFTVTRSAEIVDVRHMNEPGILTTDAPAPNDGFGRKFSAFVEDPGVTASITSPVCGNKSALFHDAGAGRSLRPHRISSIDLDQGVTVVWAVASANQGGSDGSEPSWELATMLVGDKVGSDAHMASVRTRASNVGIVTTNPSAILTGGSGFTNADWPISSEYRIIRLTGRNMIAGDYNSTVWKVYVNESAAPVLTSTGTITASVVESNPSYLAEITASDCIAIGQGSGGLTGDWNYDHTAVNGSGDYAPGEWNPFGDSAYPTISGAKLPGVESRPVTISGPSVITKVLTHIELQGDPPAEVTVQDGFYAQDVIANGKNLGGVKVLTADTKGNAVAVGVQIIALSGVMIEQVGGRVLANPAFTLTGTASAASIGMSQKNIYGPCLGQGLDTTGMMVKIFGRVTLVNIDYDLFGGAGGYVFYVNDGSGAIDGRDVDEGGNPIPGIRIVIRLDDPVFPGVSIGEYVMVEGVAGYELATLPDLSTAYVRQILYPTVTPLGCL